MTVIATAGHVDHGKSSLIRALTGIEPDRLEEEQRRGMTIDLGFAFVETPTGTTLSFIDVPGHTDFIRTMISGVSGVNVALLVIDVGEGWKPQTEEHLGILEVLGITHGVVALTKCDRVDETIINACLANVKSRIAHSSIQWSAVICTSAHTGRGLKELLHALADLTATIPADARNRSPRLFIDRVFTIKGAGTVVTGTLDSSPLHKDDPLILARNGDSIRVRSIQVHGQDVETCEVGSRCALNVLGINTDGLSRGDALIAPSSWLTTNVFDARITTLKTLRTPLTHRGSFTLHIGSSYQSAQIRVIGAQEIAPGSQGRIRIRFDHSQPLVPGDQYLLRDTSTNTTIGGGVILDIAPMSRISHANPDGSVESILQGRGIIPVVEAQMLTGVPLNPTFGHWFASPEVVRDAVQKLELRLHEVSVLSLSELLQYERELLSLIPQAIVDGDVVRLNNSDPLSSHPLLQQILEWGLTGPSTKIFDRNIMRQLIQRGWVFEHDSIAFHVETLEAMRPTLQKLWNSSPEGFAVSQLRESLGITRKHAVPLSECLDKVGLTRRVSDLRLPGTRW